MAVTKITGSGAVSDADYRYVRYTGKTKSGNPVRIELPVAICMSNPDWSFAEKDDTTAEIEFTGCYQDDALASDDRTEPWSIEIADGQTSGNGEILLGVGRLEIGTSASAVTSIGLSRGGGSFVVEREYRLINADNDPGPVQGRITLEGGVPRLKLTALQWITKIGSLYAGMKTTT